ASLMTGTYPYLHGVSTNGDRLPESVDTIAELFARRGYHCAGFVTNVSLKNSEFGFGQGFQEWMAYPLSESHAERILQDAAEWIRQHRQDKFFVWIHLIDPHSPY